MQKAKHDFQVANQEISLILFEMSTWYRTADRIAYILFDCNLCLMFKLSNACSTLNRL